MSAGFRLVTYNFLTGGSERRGGHWSHLLDAFSPDVVFAQECRPPEDSPGEVFRPGAADAFHWCAARAGRWGSAVLVRSARLTPIDVPDYAGWVVGGEIDGLDGLSGRPLRLFSIHCPAGAGGYVRTLHRILDRLAPLGEDADLVLGGDFNVVVGTRLPGAPIKVTRGERELLERLADELGLTSCWQAANPGRPLAQTLRWSGNRSAPYHCDGIFVPAAWRARLEACEVAQGPPWDRLSDHNPVVATFAPLAEAVPADG
ncbi:MAG TPA: endonuclease/exonuclease/phosphatase family protein [Longimicrobiales bacterium]